MICGRRLGLCGRSVGTLDFARNEATLGRAFDITGWSDGARLRPVVSVAERGDGVSLTNITSEAPEHFSQSAEEVENQRGLGERGWKLLADCGG